VCGGGGGEGRWGGMRDREGGSEGLSEGVNE